MTTAGVLLTVEAKPGKEDDAARLFTAAQSMVERELGTLAWFAIRLGPRTFGVFDAFAGEDERQAHLGGEVPGLASAVVTHGGARVRVAGRFLHVADRDAGVERGGDEGMTERVGADLLVDPGGSSGAGDDAGGGVVLHSGAVGREEDRPVGAFADGEVEGSGHSRCERHVDDLAALAGHGQGSVAAYEAPVVDVRAEGFGDA